MLIVWLAAGKQQLLAGTVSLALARERQEGRKQQNKAGGGGRARAGGGGGGGWRRRRRGGRRGPGGGLGGGGGCERAERGSGPSRSASRRLRSEFSCFWSELVYREELHQTDRTCSDLLCNLRTLTATVRP